MVTVYLLKQDGEFLAAKEARESPLEPGVFLIPRSATTIKPPKAKAGHALVFKDGAWVHVEDHRGKAVHSMTGSSVWMSLGPLPDNVSLEPRPDAFHIWDKSAKKWVEDADRRARQERQKSLKKINSTADVETRLKHLEDAILFLLGD